jgi:uncharacterized membrane protein
LFDQPPLAFLLQQPLSIQRQQLHLLLALAAGFFLAALTIGHVLGHRVEVDKLAVATAAGVAEMAGFIGVAAEPAPLGATTTSDVIASYSGENQQ